MYRTKVVLPAWTIAELDRLRQERDAARSSCDDFQRIALEAIAERDRARDSLQAILEGGIAWDGEHYAADRKVALSLCRQVADQHAPMIVTGPAG